MTTKRNPSVPLCRPQYLQWNSFSRVCVCDASFSSSARRMGGREERSLSGRGKGGKGGRGRDLALLGRRRRRSLTLLHLLLLPPNQVQTVRRRKDMGGRRRRRRRSVYLASSITYGANPPPPSYIWWKRRDKSPPPSSLHSPATHGLGGRRRRRKKKGAPTEQGDPRIEIKRGHLYNHTILKNPTKLRSNLFQKYSFLLFFFGTRLTGKPDYDDVARVYRPGLV